MVNRIIDDTAFMQKALVYARKAYEEDEIPIGAVVISQDGDILGVGSNKTEQLACQSRHAEVIAIEQAGNVLQNWRLVGCTLYVTLQPCLMCMSLIGLSRISRVVYGAKSPIFGFDLDNEELPQVYRKHRGGISSGILEEESQQLLEQFFREKREKGEELRTD